MSTDPFAQFKAIQREGWALFAPIEALTTIPAGVLVQFAGVEAGQRVLDVACGTGVVAVTAARRGANVRGLDLSPVLLEHARRNAQTAGVDIEFSEGDVEALPYADASFDVVFTSNLLEHLPSKSDVEELLRDVSRVLKRGGHLIALGPNLRFLPGEYWDFWDHHTGITDRSLVELLSTLDFSVADCIPRFLPYTTRSALPCTPWLVRLYLKLPLAWTFLGKQFLIRAMKP